MQRLLARVLELERRIEFYGREFRRLQAYVRTLEQKLRELASR